MKKLGTIIIAFAVITSLAACRKSNEPETVAPTADATTTETTMIPDIIPDVLPTLETNIPDPSVDTEMPMYTDGTEDTTDNTESVK